MRRGLFIVAVIAFAGNLAGGELPKEFDRSDRLFQLGLLDVTKAPTRPIRVARATRPQPSNVRSTTLATRDWSASSPQERT